MLVQRIDQGRGHGGTLSPCPFKTKGYGGEGTFSYIGLLRRLSQFFQVS